MVNADSARATHSYAFYWNPILQWIRQFPDDQTNPTVVYKIEYRILKNFSSSKMLWLKDFYPLWWIISGSWKTILIVFDNIKPNIIYNHESFNQ